jgi:antitoxin component YwqK of YwqJK toxin-antitoxin module
MKVLRRIWILLFILWSEKYVCQKKFVQFFYDSGKLSSEGWMVDGKPDLEWKSFYESGQIKSAGKRKFGELDSIWEFFTEQGYPEKKTSYKNGLKDGLEILFDAKGKKLSEIQFEKGIRSGQAQYYYPGGALWKLVKFKENKEEGRSLEYAEDGRIITEYLYKSGFVYAEERINRYDSEQQKTGVWKIFFESGMVREEGGWQKGLKHGIHKYYDDTGKFLKIERYEMGMLIENDESTSVPDIRREYYANGIISSEGTMIGGKKQGNFRLYNEQGEENGGELYDKDRLVARGMIDSLGRRQGDWIFFYESGEKYSEGRYDRGMKQGPWKFYYKNGKTEQEGSYSNDLAFGSWKWYFNTGALHREEFYKKGKEDGTSVEYDTVGVVINQGEYIEGYRTGQWNLWVNDHREEGEFVDGERNGLWLWYYGEDQKAFEGKFENGLAVGTHKKWHPNGNLMEVGKYEAGERNGKWQFFNEYGISDLELEYSAGRVIRINGAKILETEMD